MTLAEALLGVLGMFWLGALGASALSCLYDGLVWLWRKLT